MSQGGGTGGKADYGERGCDGAVEEGETAGMGGKGEWDKGKGGGDCERRDYIQVAKGERRNLLLFIMQFKLKNFSKF